jgi:hypothetical protein
VPPNPTDPLHRHSILDRAAFIAKLDELMEASRAEALREGRSLDSGDVSRAASGADAFARGTPLAVAGTSLINGDPIPARELCERERQTNGDAAATELMTKIEAAVAERRAMIAASHAARQARPPDHR